MEWEYQFGIYFRPNSSDLWETVTETSKSSDLEFLLEPPVKLHYLDNMLRSRKSTMEISKLISSHCYPNIILNLARNAHYLIAGKRIRQMNMEFKGI